MECPHMTISVGLSNKPFCVDCRKYVEWSDLKEDTLSRELQKQTDKRGTE